MFIALGALEYLHRKDFNPTVKLLRAPAGSREPKPTINSHFESESIILSLSCSYTVYNEVRPKGPVQGFWGPFLFYRSRQGTPVQQPGTMFLLLVPLMYSVFFINSGIAAQSEFVLRNILVFFSEPPLQISWVRVLLFKNYKLQEVCYDIA